MSCVDGCTGTAQSSHWEIVFFCGYLSPCIHVSSQATAGLLFYLLRAQPIVTFYKLNVHAGEHTAGNVKKC